MIEACLRSAEAAESKAGRSHAHGLQTLQTLFPSLPVAWRTSHLIAVPQDSLGCSLFQVQTEADRHAAPKTDMITRQFVFG